MSNNYFTLFEIEPDFSINYDELEKKYISLSKSAINKNQLKNMENINKAYQVLRSPLKRAEYLLNLFGVNKQKDHLNDEILNESIEIREYLTGGGNDLQLINKIINDKINICTKNLFSAFSTENFCEAATQVLRLRYLYKSLEEVKKNEANSNF